MRLGDNVGTLGRRRQNLLMRHVHLAVNSNGTRCTLGVANSKISCSSTSTGIGLAARRPATNMCALANNRVISLTDSDPLHMKRTPKCSSTQNFIFSSSNNTILHTSNIIRYLGSSNTSYKIVFSNRPVQSVARNLSNRM